MWYTFNLWGRAIKFSCFSLMYCWQSRWLGRHDLWFNISVTDGIIFTQFTIHPKIYAHCSRFVAFCCGHVPNDFTHIFRVTHDDVIKWKHFPRYWPFVLGIHRSPVNSLHKGQWRRALVFSLISARNNGWISNGKAGDLRRHRAHYDVTVMFTGTGTIARLPDASEATLISMDGII